MHGLINRSLEDFVRHTYGDEVWRKILDRLDLGIDSFEPMFTYDDSVSQALVHEAARVLDKPPHVFLEDYGTFLVTNPQSERVRRLLRFGGVDFLDFLHSLDDLRGRARLAMPDLDLPDLDLTELGGGAFHLDCEARIDGFAQVVLGVLRAMADDYGALVLVENQGRQDGAERLSVTLLDSDFSEGKDFNLAQALP